MASQSLTPVIRATTNVPYPKRSAVTGVNWEAVDGRTITVEACSEFIEHCTTLDHFSTRDRTDGRSDKLAIISDGHSQPLIFSIGSDHRLYMLAHVNNGQEGWQSFNLTFPEAKDVLIDHLDVIDGRDKIYLAATLANPSTSKKLKADLLTHTIWHTAFARPSLGMEGGKLTGFKPDDLKWSKIANNLGNKCVTTMSCMLGPSIEGSTVGFWIGAGAINADGGTACYIINPAVEDSWEAIETVVPAVRIGSVQAAVRGSAFDAAHPKAAIATLVNRFGSGEAGLYVDSFSGPLRTRTSVALLTASLGNVHGFYASRTVYGMTDIFAAGENGLGFYHFERPEQLECILLSGISLRQVTCIETRNDKSDIPEILSRLSILALSVADELYFIQGYRDHYNKVTFDIRSGIPIRNDVKRMSVQYNYHYLSTEILYVSRQQPNQLNHLVRDPVTSMWNEQPIKVSSGSISKITKSNAYITTITLTDGVGNLVPDGYPLLLTGPRSAVSINGASVMLNHKATKLSTKAGKLHIVAPCSGLHGASPYQLELIEPTKSSYRLDVQPSQRVHRMMSEVPDGHSLAGLKNGHGRVIFDGYPQEKLDELAKLMKLSSSYKQDGTLSTQTQQLAAAYRCLANDDSLNIMAEDGSSWLGDVFEAIYNGAKTVTDVVIKYAANAWLFSVRIQSKVIHWAINRVGTLLKAISAGLKYLGVDTKRLDDWLRFLLTNEATLETQKVLNGILKTSAIVSERFLRINRDSLKDGLGDARTYLAKLLSNPKKPSNTAPSQGSAINKISDLLNNPVVDTLLKMNPLMMALDALGRSFDESGMRIPDMTKLAKRLAQASKHDVDFVVKALWAMIKTIGESAASFLADPAKLLDILATSLSSQLWTLFDAVEKMALNLFDLMADLVAIIHEIGFAEWRLPGITDIWEDQTGQPFTLIGALTYAMSSMLNLASMYVYGRTPFGKGQSVPDHTDVDIPRLYRSSSGITMYTLDDVLPSNNHTCEGLVGSEAGMKTFQIVSDRTSSMLNQHDPAKDVPASRHGLDKSIAVAQDDDDEDLEKERLKKTKEALNQIAKEKKARVGRRRSARQLHGFELFIECLEELTTLIAIAKDLFYARPNVPQRPNDPRPGDGLQHFLEDAGFIFTGVSLALNMSSSVMYMVVQTLKEGKFVWHDSYWGFVTSWLITGLGWYLKRRHRATYNQIERIGGMCNIIGDILSNISVLSDKNHDEFRGKVAERFLTVCRITCSTGELIILAGITCNITVVYEAAPYVGALHLLVCLGESIWALVYYEPNVDEEDYKEDKSKENPHLPLPTAGASSSLATPSVIWRRYGNEQEKLLKSA